MTVDDVVLILEAVGDSWPAALVVIAGIIAFVLIKAMPKLNEIINSLKIVKHEFNNNSGKTLRDAIDRIETAQSEQTTMLSEHIAEDQTWKENTTEMLLRNDIT